MRKLFITGASGFVGQALLPALKLEGYDIAALSRKVRDTSSGVRWVLGDPVTVDDWQREVDGAFGSSIWPENPSSGSGGRRSRNKRCATAAW